jgi:hypothetical protein
MCGGMHLSFRQWAGGVCVWEDHVQAGLGKKCLPRQKVSPYLQINQSKKKKKKKKEQKKPTGVGWGVCGG